MDRDRGIRYPRGETRLTMSIFLIPLDRAPEVVLDGRHGRLQARCRVGDEVARLDVVVVGKVVVALTIECPIIQRRLDAVAELERERGPGVDGAERQPRARRLAAPLCGAEQLASMAYYLPCLLYTSPSPRDGLLSRMPSSA